MSDEKEIHLMLTMPATLTSLVGWLKGKGLWEEAKNQLGIDALCKDIGPKIMTDPLDGKCTKCGCTPVSGVFEHSCTPENKHISLEERAKKISNKFCWPYQETEYVTQQLYEACNEAVRDKVIEMCEGENCFVAQKEQETFTQGFEAGRKKGREEMYISGESKAYLSYEEGFQATRKRVAEAERMWTYGFEVAQEKAAEIVNKTALGVTNVQELVERIREMKP